MNTVNHITPETLADLKIEWTAGDTRETQRGKIKPVVVGIPGHLFFYRYKKHAETRAQVRALGITLKRIAKNNWEAIAWINKHTYALFAALPGVEIPEVITAKQDAPF